MKNSLTQLTLALAGMGLGEHELWKLLHELRKIPPELMVERVRFIRQSAFFDVEGIYDKSRLAMPKMSLSNKEPSVGQRVERLLKTEAHLSTQQAAELLRMKLIENGLGTKSSIPELYKKALNIWVDRVARSIPAKELLRFATIIRNERVHSPASDWSISGKST